jgi:Rv0078B-related antitoxin
VGTRRRLPSVAHPRAAAHPPPALLTSAADPAPTRASRADWDTTTGRGRWRLGAASAILAGVSKAAAIAERYRLTLDLFAAGEQIMRQNLRRRFPDADAREIEAYLVEWLQARPGAEGGDAVGRIRPWPRR